MTDKSPINNATAVYTLFDFEFLKVWNSRG